MVQPPRGFNENQRTRSAPLVQNNVWGGWATIGSGVAAVTVSHAFINSGMGILLTPFPTSFGAIGSASGILCVRSINPLTAFVIGNETAVTKPWDQNVYWEIKRVS